MGRFIGGLVVGWFVTCLVWATFAQIDRARAARRDAVCHAMQDLTRRSIHDFESCLVLLKSCGMEPR